MSLIPALLLLTFSPSVLALYRDKSIQLETEFVFNSEISKGEEELIDKKAVLNAHCSGVSTKQIISTSSPMQSGELGENEILLPRVRC